MTEFEKAKLLESTKKNLFLKRIIGVLIMLFFIVVSYLMDKNIIILIIGIIVFLIYFGFVVFPQYKKYKNLKE